MYNNLTDQIKAATTTMEFAACPVCGSQLVRRLPDDWQTQTAAIPILDCGNPWHYAIKSLGDSPDA